MDSWRQRELRDSEYLSTVKAGDEVLVYGRWDNHIAKVYHTTANYVDVADNGRYRRSDGRAVGKHKSSKIGLPTDEDREEIERRQLVGRLHRVSGDLWSKLTLCSLREINVMLDAVLTDGGTNG